MTARAFAPAKVNLALHVTGRRSDGYHLLDSIVVFADVGDEVLAAPAGETSLQVEGPFAAKVPVDERNLVLRAAQFAGLAARLTLVKRLPAAAGLGGGSSDAAAALRALALLGAALPDDTLALGADVPACLVARPLRMRGIGERLDPLPLPDFGLVLANPGAAAPTAEVYRRLDRADRPGLPEQLPGWPDAEALADWLQAQRNDLEPSAIAVAPVIADVLAALARLPGACFARMSGSGATAFALFHHRKAAEAAACLLRAEHPAWWIAAAGLWQPEAGQDMAGNGVRF